MCVRGGINIRVSQKQVQTLTCNLTGLVLHIGLEKNQGKSTRRGSGSDMGHQSDIANLKTKIESTNRYWH